MTKPVFSIIQEYDELMNQIEELDGEITPEIASKLIINENELAQKIRAYYFVIKTKEAEINLAKEEQERLNNVKKTKENLIKRLKKVVDLAVETFGTVKPNGAKGLDLGDLKVWQKKTEALELLGEIDDERFCERQFVIKCDYNIAKEFHELLKTTAINYNPIESINVLKDKLKQWLIDNEEKHKLLRQKAAEITDVEFEDANIQLVGEEETQEEKDMKIVLATQLNHNSTVIFK